MTRRTSASSTTTLVFDMGASCTWPVRRMLATGRASLLQSRFPVLRGDQHERQDRSDRIEPDRREERELERERGDGAAEG